MNKTTLLGMLTTAVFVSTASLALGQATQKGQGQQQPREQRPAQGQGQGQGQAQGQHQGQGQGQAQGQHQGHQAQGQAQSLAQEQFEARIVAVDKSKSTVSVETPQHGQLEFKLTPAQVQRLSEGDQVHLQIQIHSMPKQP